MTHMFDMRCREHDIEHRFTKVKHPWSNGQSLPSGLTRWVERMNRTIKDATVKRFHYDSHDQLRRHLQDFIDAYNFGRRLKTLKGLTPYAFICKQCIIEPERFTLNPIHQMPGLNTLVFSDIASEVSIREHARISGQVLTGEPSRQGLRLWQKSPKVCGID